MITVRHWPARRVGVGQDPINPGNIGSDDRVKEVVRACRAGGIPIRIGVNGGSLEKHILAKYGAPVPEAWWKAPSTTSACWKSLTLTTSSSPSRAPTCPG